jgi:hypothetical protein
VLFSREHFVGYSLPYFAAGMHLKPLVQGSEVTDLVAFSSVYRPKRNSVPLFFFCGLPEVAICMVLTDVIFNPVMRDHDTDSSYCAERVHQRARTESS